MRVPSNIFEITETAINFIKENDTLLPLPSAGTENEVAIESGFSAYGKEDHSEIQQNIPQNNFVKSDKSFDDAPPAKGRKKDIDVNKIADPHMLAKWNSEVNETKILH